MDNRQPETGTQRDGPDGIGREVPSAEELSAEIRSRAEAQRPRVADSAQHAADAARQAARDLRGQEAWMAGLVEHGAGRLTELAKTLRENDLRTLVNRAEDFARDQPVLFTGAAVAVGFMLSRAIGGAQRSGSNVPHAHEQEPVHEC